MIQHLEGSRREHPYVVIDNRPLNDARLSFAAMGVLAHLLSKPPQWKIIVSALVKNFPKATENSIRSALRELREFGYAELIPLMENGKMAGTKMIIHEVPIPVTEIAVSRAPDSTRGREPREVENPRPLVSKERLVSKKGEERGVLAKASKGASSRESESELDLGFHVLSVDVPAKKQISDAQDDFLWVRERLMATFPGYQFRKSDSRDKAIKWFLKKHGREEFDRLMQAIHDSDYLMARGIFSKEKDGVTERKRKDPSFPFGKDEKTGMRFYEKILDGFYSNENATPWWTPKAPPPTSYSADDFIKVKLSDSTGIRVVTMKKSDVGDKNEKYLIISRDNDGIPTVTDQTHILEDIRKHKEACKT